MTKILVKRSNAFVHTVVPEDIDPVITADNVQLPRASLAYYTDAELEEHKLFLVEPVSFDSSKYVKTADSFTMIAGIMTHVPVLAVIGLEERRITVRDAISQKHKEVKTGGFHYNFGTEELPQFEIMQIRHEEDQLNWLILEGTCRDALLLGAGEVICAQKIRVASNNEYQLTYAKTKEILDLLKMWGGRILTQSWALKDLLDTAADHDDLDEVCTLIDTGIVDEERELTGWS